MYIDQFKKETFSPDSLPDINTSLVYGWRRITKYLYIGKSIRGIQRILRNHVIKSYRINKVDKIDIWFCLENEVDELEKLLIGKHKPKYNITHTNRRTVQKEFDDEGNQICVECKKKFPSRSNKRFCDNQCRTSFWNKRYSIENSENKKAIDFIEKILSETKK